MCKDEMTGLSLELQRVMEDPLGEEGRKGAAWRCQDKGLGAKGTCHIKRGERRCGGSLQPLTLIIPRAARLLQMRTALAIQP